MFVIIVITIMIAGSGKAIAQWEGGREGWMDHFICPQRGKCVSIMGVEKTNTTTLYIFTIKTIANIEGRKNKNKNKINMISDVPHISLYHLH